MEENQDEGEGRIKNIELTNQYLILLLLRKGKLLERNLTKQIINLLEDGSRSSFPPPEGSEARRRGGIRGGGGGSRRAAGRPRPSLLGATRAAVAKRSKVEGKHFSL